ncbi:MAG: hypothetical protein HGB35_06470, partial [Geobacteraceae bacterium]|nr:hypothetical protein [Geobacteraceae bacterium]
MTAPDDELLPIFPRQERIVKPAKEYAEIDILLDDLMLNGRLNIYPEVLGRRFFNIYLKKDSLVFQAGGFIGQIPINDYISIDIRPRAPVRNLERIIRIADHKPISLAPYMRTYGVDSEEIPSLLDILTDSLIGSIEDIRSQGVYQEYAQKRSDTSFPRGRSLIQETLRRHHAVGVHHKVTASWFEHSRDNALNQCVKYAIWYLAQRYKSRKPETGYVARLSRLNTAFMLFYDVKLDLSRRFLNDPLVVNPEQIPVIRSH